MTQICLLGNEPLQAGGIYRWVDAEGRTVYGDEPPQTAAPSLVEIPPGPPERDSVAPVTESADEAVADKAQERKMAVTAQAGHMGNQGCADLLLNLKNLKREEAVYRDESGAYQHQKSTYSERYGGQRYYLGDSERVSVITELDLRYRSECRQSDQSVERYERLVAEQEKSRVCDGLDSEIARLQRATQLRSDTELDSLQSRYQSVCGPQTRLQRF